MPSFRPDAKGYYARLGLAPTASAEDIKAAYRRLAKELHPDANPRPEASARFSDLQEAFQTLSNPERRAAYDQLHESLSRAGGLLDPLACASCGAVTPNLRYVILDSIRGRGFRCETTPRDGLYCPDCRAAQAVVANAGNWLFGWWSLPKAPFLNLRALFRNATGGVLPPEDNARLLAYQARALASQQKLASARQAAIAASLFAQRQKSLSPLAREMKLLLQQIPSAAKPQVGQIFWRRPFLQSVQLLPLLAIAVLLVALMPRAVPEGRPPRHQAPIASKPATNDQGSAHHVIFDGAILRMGPGPERQAIERLSRFDTVMVVGRAENGWLLIRTSAGRMGYLSGAHLGAGSGDMAWLEDCRRSITLPPATGTLLLQRAQGHHTLMLRNNAQADAIVKMRDRTAATLMAVFVRKGETAVVENVPDGEFRISYAVGEDYSSTCTTFLKNFRAHAFPESDLFRTGTDSGYQTVTRIEYTLITEPASRSANGSNAASQGGTTIGPMAFSRN